jgi:DNA-directed RNA polymerase specialized sigma24 family protein
LRLISRLVAPRSSQSGHQLDEAARAARGGDGRRVVATGGSDLQSMLDMVPATDEPDTIQFDREFHRALFHRAGARVRGEVHSATWQAFWETAVVGTSSADAAMKLGMTVGAVRVAKCRVLARLQAAVAELENPT